MRKFVKAHVFLWFALFTLLFQEIVFQVTLSGSIVRGSRFALLLFTVIYGLIIYLLGTIVKNPGTGKVIRAVLLGLTAVPFLVWNFIFAKFRILYDVATTVGGASDAVGGFAGDIFRLIFSVNGMVHIVLFFLPCLLYCFWGRKQDDEAALSARGRLTVIGGCCLLWAVCLAFMRDDAPLEQVYAAEYQFENAVSNFGLYTGIRLDIKYQYAGVEPMQAETAAWGYDGMAALSEAVDVSSGDTGEINSTEPATADASEDTMEDTAEDKAEDAAEGAAEDMAVDAVEGSAGDKAEDAAEGAVEDTAGDAVEGSAGDMVADTAEDAAEDAGWNVLDIDFDALEEGASEELAEVDAYVRALEPTSKNAYTGLFQGKNLIFISAEAFTAEVIDPELTPTLYRLATKGINFTDYYQPASAGTTGGEYANLMGMLPTAGGKSMKNTKNNHNYMTIGSLLNGEGYYGKAFHNNNYKYYDRHKTHVNLGYSDGYMGYGNGMEAYVQKTWPESDLEMMEGTLPTYIDRQPFNIYYMSVSGHSDYSVEENAMSKKHWDEVKDLDYSDKVKAYLAAQLELEAALTYLVDELEKAGIADDTVICISADHFPYGLDQNETGAYDYLSELYGYEVTDNFERDHNRLILWSGCLEDEEPIVVSSPTFSPDILPTLCNLFGVEYDSRLLPGRDVFSDSEALVYDLSYNWKTEYGTYYASKGKFVPADDDIEIPDGYVDRMKQIVKNKIWYSKKVLNLDYYAHVLSDTE